MLIWSNIFFSKFFYVKPPLPSQQIIVTSCTTIAYFFIKYSLSIENHKNLCEFKCKKTMKNQPQKFIIPSFIHYNQTTLKWNIKSQSDWLNWPSLVWSGRQMFANGDRWMVIAAIHQQRKLFFLFCFWKMPANTWK